MHTKEGSSSLFSDKDAWGGNTKGLTSLSNDVIHWMLLCRKIGFLLEVLCGLSLASGTQGREIVNTEKAMAFLALFDIFVQPFIVQLNAFNSRSWPYFDCNLAVLVYELMWLLKCATNPWGSHTCFSLTSLLAYAKALKASALKLLRILFSYTIKFSFWKWNPGWWPSFLRNRLNGSLPSNFILKSIFFHMIGMHFLLFPPILRSLFKKRRKMAYSEIFGKLLLKGSDFREMSQRVLGP